MWRRFDTKHNQNNLLCTIMFDKGTSINDVPHFFAIFDLPTYLVLLYNVPFLGLSLTPLPTLIWDVINERSPTKKDWYSRSEIVHRNSKQPLMRPFQEPNQQTKAKKRSCFQMSFGNSGGQARLFNTTNTYFKALISISCLSRQRALVSLGLFTKMNGTLLCKLSISASQNKIVLSIIHQIGFTRYSCQPLTNS